LEDEDDLTAYILALKEAWIERLGELSQEMATTIAQTLGNEYKYKMRYVFNGLRVWFVPNPTFDEGFIRPFAEEPTPKDKWYSTTDIMAYTIPPMPDSEISDQPRTIFGPERWLQERYPDPEVQGGRIALIAFKQDRVQKPPNCLDRMNSRYLKQVAYNDRIIGAEKEVAALNCDPAEFLDGMTLDPSERVIVCIIGSEEMKRDEMQVAGQLWLQGDRRMTASNHVHEGLANTRQRWKRFNGRMLLRKTLKGQGKACESLCTRRIWTS
jgi:hypothetical protein